MYAYAEEDYRLWERAEGIAVTPGMFDARSMMDALGNAVRLRELLRAPELPGFWRRFSERGSVHGPLQQACFTHAVLRSVDEEHE